MQNNSNMSWYEGHTITSLGKIFRFSKFYVQNIWQVVRQWHHQLAHLHIHIDWSRNVLWKLVKFQSVITSLFFNQISSGFHCFVQKFVTLSSEIKLNLFRSSPLKHYALYTFQLVSPCSGRPHRLTSASGGTARMPCGSWTGCLCWYSMCLGVKVNSLYNFTNLTLEGSFLKWV